MTGQKLGNYEIVDKLGEGGMGEVWRARDIRLNRTVAIKMLSSEVAADPARRQRFELEARALGALNHPNIVAVYDVGQQDGRSYIVSELVDGESLRKTIERGPIPARKLLDIAIQIADAIAAAHALGIVHRDLKPENIMITRDNRVKVLDFGLAKQKTITEDDSTVTMALSQPGTVMGTVGYMSPEQVRGEKVDNRSDIFSFGCVLHELETGKRAFDGQSTADVMSAILKEEPAELTASPGLDGIIRRCLEKNPGQRFQSAADLAFALRSLSNPSVSRPAISVAPPARRKWLAPVIAAAGAVALFGAGYLARDRFSANALPHFQRLTFRQGIVGAARFGPDGQSVIYNAAWDGGLTRTYLATPGAPESRDLQMPADSRLLSVSSKGDLAFLVGPFGIDGSGTLQRSSISGGQMRDLLEGVVLADWSPDGSAMAVVRQIGGRYRLEYPVGKVLVEHNHDWPFFSIRISPDGERVAFSEWRGGGSRISILTMDRSGKWQSLGVVSGQTSTSGTQLCWTRDGREIWFRSFDANDLGTVYAIDMKGRRRIVARVPGRVSLFDVSAEGKALLSTNNDRIGILALAPGESVERDLSCLDAGLLKGISDDGRIILAGVAGEGGGPKGSIYLRHTDGSPAIRLGDGVAFSLSPDGKWVAGYSSTEMANRKYMLTPTGAGEEVEISVPQLPDKFALIMGWLPGERNYLIMGLSAHHKVQYFAWDAVHGSVRAVSPESMPDNIPLVSPDGREYLSQGPDRQWYAYPLQGGDSVRVPSLGEHDIPINWRSDGKALYVVTHMDENRKFQVSLLDIKTGQRSSWKEIRAMMPVDSVEKLRITPDGRAYAYNYSRASSELFVADGLR
jgi:Tol biopolymer transport system component/predicted Ser/Thr protein kinase